MTEQAIPGAQPRLLSRSFASLLVANVCFGYAFSSFLLLPRYLAEVLGAGPAEVGTLAAASGAAVVLLLPLMGAAVDRFGRRDFLTAGALLMALASAAYPAVDHVGVLLYELRILQGSAFAMVYAAGGALAVDLAPRGRLGQAIGIYGLSFLSMNAVAPASVELVVAFWGWPLAFETAAAGALLCALLSRRVFEPARGAEEGELSGTLWQILARADTLRALLVIALVGSAISAVFNFHQLFALELGVGPISSFFVAYSCAAITMRAGFGHLIDRWGHRRSAVAALGLYVFVVLAVADLEQLGLPLLGAGLGVAHGVFYPSFNAVVVSAAASGERGRFMALFQAAFQVGMACGGLGFGLLAERAGYPAVFEMAAVGVGIAWILLVAKRRSPPRSRA